MSDKAKDIITEIEVTDAAGNPTKIKWNETKGGALLSRVEAVTTKEADKAAGVVVIKSSAPPMTVAKEPPAKDVVTPQAI